MIVVYGNGPGHECYAGCGVQAVRVLRMTAGGWPRGYCERHAGEVEAAGLVAADVTAEAQASRNQQRIVWFRS